MKINLLTFITRVTALAFFVGALPFVNNAHIYASERSESEYGNEGSESVYRYTTERSESEYGDASVSKEEGKSKWLDDYSKPVGWTYNAQAKVQAAYLWRGLYCGAFNLQANANTGYGGLYADLWWNVGTTDWSFSTFQPEVDITIGFSRWGLDVFAYMVHNFDCGFFDWGNYPDKGNRFEVDARWTVSSKLPLSVLWATRVAASDGYLNALGDTIRAFSSYAELSYTQHLPYGMSLFGAVGITPWKSCYTGFQGDFAVTNVEVRLRKDWELSAHCGLMVQGQIVVNPYAIAKDKSSVEWHPKNPGGQSVNANVTVGVYLK